MLKLVLSYCLFVGVDIIYIDLCLTIITELYVGLPIMADGVGWIKKFRQMTISNITHTYALQVITIHVVVLYTLSILCLTTSTTKNVSDV